MPGEPRKKKRCGGDPPDQEIFPILERQPPRGSVLRRFLGRIGVADPNEVSRRLERACIDLTPSGEKPAKPLPRTPETERPAPQPAPPLYSDEITREARLGGWLKWSSSWKRTGPTAPPEGLSMWRFVADLSRRYHLAWLSYRLAVWILIFLGLTQPANRIESPPTTPVAKRHVTKTRVPPIDDRLFDQITCVRGEHKASERPCDEKRP